jgi:hypothetical protein
MLYVSNSPLPYLAIYGERELGGIDSFHQPRSRTDLINLMLMPPHLDISEGVLNIRPRRLLISCKGDIPKQHESRNVIIIHTDLKNLGRDHPIITVSEEYLYDLLEPYRFIFTVDAYKTFWDIYKAYPKVLLMNLQDLINVFKLEGRLINTDDLDIAYTDASFNEYWKAVMTNSDISRILINRNPTLLMEVRRDVELGRLDVKAAFHILNNYKR